jgi:hypothetical protein
MSSLVTDGASANTGEKGGLWTLLEQMQKDCAVESSDPPPLMKFWCAVHRSNLAWESVSESVSEINHIFQHLTGICSFFHRSGLRSRELRDIAAENSLTLLKLPKIFEVRLDAVLL